MATGFWEGSDGNTSTSRLLPRVASCSIAAGRYTSAETISTFFFVVLRMRRASLPALVVLPEPCRPASRITAGGWVANESAALAPPISSTSSWWTTPTSAWPGVRLPATSWPSAFSFTLATKSFTTGRPASASRSARRTSRSISCTLSSVRREWPRSVLTTEERRSVRASSMGNW